MQCGGEGHTLVGSHIEHKPCKALRHGGSSDRSAGGSSANIRPLVGCNITRTLKDDPEDKLFAPAVPIAFEVSTVPAVVMAECMVGGGRVK
jgi:hypothetical protein